MSNPFLIQGPAVIACSFGRTSGYMLFRILDAHGGQLPPDVHVMFENTGMEAEETLAFGAALQARWCPELRWLEYRRKFLPNYKSDARRLIAEKARRSCGHVYEPADGRKEPGFVYVTHAAAARRRDGNKARHPFHNLIDLMGLPNPLTRLCTSEMKIRVAKKAMMALGYEEWTNVIGLRYDEPRRVARMRGGQTGERWENACPLSDARVTKAEVLAFWAKQDFDLDLPVDAAGETYGGNCDLCFLKGTDKKLRLIREDPSAATWWAKQERRTGQTFRERGATVRLLFARAMTKEEPPVPNDADDLGDCVCHD